MYAMMMRRAQAPLEPVLLPDPVPGPGEVRLRVGACGVCRTDLHVIDGDLAAPALPLIPGHEIVGRIDALGDGVDRFAIGERVGVGWLGWTCETCAFCRSGRENLCDAPRFTGYTRNGGFASLTVADARFTYPLGEAGSDAEMAPLMCAGLIGWRSLVSAGNARRLGIYGFGAAGHIILQVALWQGREVFVFTRPDDRPAQDFARRLGAGWVGGSDTLPPAPLDAAILYAPVGALVPAALKAVRKGGRVVCAGIHMSDIPAFPYSLLWEERQVVSVANLTRTDAAEFLAVARQVNLLPKVTTYPLTEANRALDDLRAGTLQGAAVLLP
ncbi:zinc-dependent alcohol dehydrogenase family protein [Aquabacter spiritensis]|uniref:alcohol dehydrogenase n=1 Tax=Aquabacter spiritensis TaxID=933073 RepID=A0A4R3LZI3_9HYPH|nr:zinc-dependent alcohol dehydrogenase family protein [Aquabacter spiritensis]TCT06092.1 propanol-preferring alcohol dehydrogenase [Aquabacter spiritensis]